MKTQFGKCLSIALDGLAGILVETQAHICAGLPGTTLVGLPDAALQESKDRVKAAVISCGIEWTDYKLTINLIPASVKKTGSSFDLSVAIAILAAENLLVKEKLKNVAFVAELGLDGKLQKVRGVLPMAISARKNHISALVVAQDNADEANLIQGIKVLSFEHLRQVIGYFS
jgi:magnesium chelatase family protein